jgi:hypothetical protein
MSSPKSDGAGSGAHKRTSVPRCCLSHPHETYQEVLANGITYEEVGEGLLRYYDEESYEFVILDEVESERIRARARFESSDREAGLDRESPALSVLRRGSGFSLAAAAEELGVTEATVSRWVSGKRTWPERFTACLLHDFGIAEESVFVARSSAAMRAEKFREQAEGNL